MISKALYVYSTDFQQIINILLQFVFFVLQIIYFIWIFSTVYFYLRHLSILVSAVKGITVHNPKIGILSLLMQSSKINDGGQYEQEIRKRKFEAIAYIHKTYICMMMMKLTTFMEEDSNQA